MGEDDGALGHGIHIAAPFKGAEVVEKAALEERLSIPPRQCGEIFQLCGAEVETLQPLYHISQTCGDGIAAGKGQLAEKQMKHCFLLRLAALPVTGGHGELIEIGEEGTGGHG